MPNYSISEFLSITSLNSSIEINSLLEEFFSMINKSFSISDSKSYVMISSKLCSAAVFPHYYSVSEVTVLYTRPFASRCSQMVCLGVVP